MPLPRLTRRDQVCRTRLRLIRGTATPASPLGNLTSADFEGVLSELRAARDAIHDSDTETAYDALNNADAELYGKTN